MKLQFSDGMPDNQTDFKQGQRGFFSEEGNPFIIIGEDDTHVWTILEKSGMYYGILKHPVNLSAIHITSDVPERARLTKEDEAIKRFKQGIKPSYSTDITEATTCGYGKLDDLGFWEFPLPEEYWINLPRGTNAK